MLDALSNSCECPATMLYCLVTSVLLCINFDVLVIG